MMPLLVQVCFGTFQPLPWSKLLLKNCYVIPLRDSKVKSCTDALDHWYTDFLIFLEVYLHCCYTNNFNTKLQLSAHTTYLNT